MLRSFLLLTALLVSFTITAQKKGYVKAKVIFNDGTVKEGHIKPMKSAVDKSLIFMADEDSDKEKLPTADLKEFSILDENGSHRYLKRKSYNYKKTKINDTEFWVQELVKGKAFLYASYTPDSRIYTGQGAAHGMPGDITFYGMKEGDEAISVIGIHFVGAFNVNTNNTFRKLASDFFKNDPEILARIEGKEWKVVECVTLFEEYNKLNP